MIEINDRAVVWPSAGVGKKRQRALQTAMGVLASCVAVEQVINALAIGQLVAPSVIGTPRKELRYAPHFAIGKGRNESSTVPYTQRWVEKLLIADCKPSRYIRIAMALLEARELGYLQTDAFTNIAMLRPGYDISTLLKELKQKRAAWEALHGAGIAMGIEPK